MISTPRIGVVLLRAEWFDSVVALPALSQAVHSDEETLLAFLGENFTLAGSWVVNSSASLSEASAELKAAELDCVVMVCQVWSEDFYLIPLRRAIGDRPLVVWCFLPWERPPSSATFVQVLQGSGPVGTLQGMGTLRNLGLDYAFTAGPPGHPRVLSDLRRAARVGQLRTWLRRAHFGVLPYRNDQMQSTFVDEFRLRAELGPSVEFLSVGELQSAAQALSREEVEAYMQELGERYPVRGVSQDTLLLAARASLGMAHLAVDRGLDLLSLNDIADELHDVLGLRPCLYPSLFEENNVLVGMEGDLGAATAMFVLNRLCGGPVMFAETWYWDEEDNTILAGHAGPQDPGLAREGSLLIAHDYEFAQSDQTEGAALLFVARAGRGTLFQLRCTPTGWQGIVATGEALDSEPRMEGYPHLVFRPDVAVVDFLYQVAAVGTTQHWGFAYGDVRPEIADFCQEAGINLLMLA